MATVNVSKMSLKELKELDRKVQKEIAIKQQLERAQVLKKMEAVANNAGFSMADIIGTKGRGKAKRPSVAKYANPDNPEETWTGRGRKPNWLVAKMKKGAKLEQFTI